MHVLSAPLIGRRSLPSEALCAAWVRPTLRATRRADRLRSAIDAQAELAAYLADAGFSPESWTDDDTGLDFTADAGEVDAILDSYGAESFADLATLVDLAALMAEDDDEPEELTGYGTVFDFADDMQWGFSVRTRP
jgi:hypothetical protein